MGWLMDLMCDVYIRCYDCNGTGTIDVTCDKCHGSGTEIYHNEEHGVCRECYGRGIKEKTCPNCHGKGEVKC